MRLREIEEIARRAAERVPAIVRVVLFGSLVNGIPTPASDADLLVEVRSSPHERPRDREPEIIDAMRPLPCAIDLHVHTTLELATAPSALVVAALREGVTLLSRE